MHVSLKPCFATSALLPLERCITPSFSCNSQLHRLYAPMETQQHSICFYLLLCVDRPVSVSISAGAVPTYCRTPFQWNWCTEPQQSCSYVMQVIDVVIHKYEHGSHGAEVFQEYEKGLQALLGAYKASSPGEHFQIAEQDSSRLEQVCMTPALRCTVLCCVVTSGKAISICFAF